jgi:hypothetical protein
LDLVGGTNEGCSSTPGRARGLLERSIDPSNYVK